MTIKYNKSMQITNIETLPHGLRCRYLLVLIALNGSYIAHSWKRVAPKTIPTGYALIDFAK